MIRRGKRQSRQKVGKSLHFLTDMVEILDLTDKLGVAARRLENERPDESFDVAEAPRKLRKLAGYSVEHACHWRVQRSGVRFAMCCHISGPPPSSRGLPALAIKAYSEELDATGVRGFWRGDRL
ncbi:protein of unknown function [Methylocella tundrae]|uniref:Uncharacterized protein n=1 Tax=Methylocella tundrae TaxID=227605 RepID=A0A4U8Z1C4_METTU|nr:protein of unknown function [Methylocella tundrae]